MTLFDRFRDAFKPEKNPTVERLHGYRRLADQIYEVEVELAQTNQPRALAILQAARCLQLMADALVVDDAGLDVHELPGMSVQRAEKWYGRIPDLLVACRQEANFPNSSQIGLPIHLKDEQYKAPSAWSVEHLLGLRRAARAVANMLSHRLEHPQFQGEKYKDVIVYYQEARTRHEAGDAIAGSLATNQQVSDESRRQAETQYIWALGRYILIVQGLEEPTLLTYEQIQVDFDAGTQSEPTYSGSQTAGAAGGGYTMNFEQMQQQSNNVQQHNQTIVNQLQQIVGKVQQLEGNDQGKLEISYALRELALSVRGLNQETMGLLQNMALYIQHLENSHQQRAQYQQQYPPQYQQQQQPVYGNGGVFGGRSGGGFWDTLIKSAEIGAGFEIGADIIDDIFGGGF